MDKRVRFVYDRETGTGKYVEVQFEFENIEFDPDFDMYEGTFTGATRDAHNAIYELFRPVREALEGLVVGLTYIIEKLIDWLDG